MQEKDAVKEKSPLVDTPAEGSADGATLSTAASIKLTGVSARSLKRRADKGFLHRTTRHTQFGLESRYLKSELEKLKQGTQPRRAMPAYPADTTHARGDKPPASADLTPIVAGLSKFLDQQGRYQVKVLEIEEKKLEIEINKSRATLEKDSVIKVCYIVATTALVSFMVVALFYMAYIIRS